MMQKKRTIALVLALCFAVLLVGGCSSQPTVGFVDMEKVVKESPKVKTLQDQLDAKEKEIMEKMQKEQSGDQAEAQQKQQALAGEYRQLQKQVGEQFESDLKKTLEQIAQEKKLTVILYKREVAQGGIDVTDEVLKRLQ